MVPADRTATTLADLRGGKIGVAGGPLDKSWIIPRAYAEQAHGLDLAAETEQVFGAPPLIFKSALDGEFDGAVNFWHFMPGMKAAGMTDLISVFDAVVALGLDTASTRISRASLPSASSGGSRWRGHWRQSPTCC